MCRYIKTSLLKHALHINALYVKLVYVQFVQKVCEDRCRFIVYNFQDLFSVSGVTEFVVTVSTSLLSL